MSILYTTEKRVLARLDNKVRITSDPENNPDLMSQALFEQLIEEAETDIEHDLSQRYAAPFQTILGKAFDQLPERPTRLFIRVLCDILSTIRVLETDFGGGSATDGDKYAKVLQKRYNDMVGKNLTRRKDTYNDWIHPPLPGLRLNFHNEAADDGFAGTIFVTGQGDGDFPSKQINDPSENFWNGQIDD